MSMVGRVVFLLFFCIQIHAQVAEYENEVGLGIGAANYYGDLNMRFDYSGAGPYASVFWRGNYGYRFSLKACLGQMHVSYADANTSSPFQNQRNLSFKSDITDLSAQIEFNFLKYVKNVFYNEQGSRFTPYVSFGAGIFTFNPQAEYKGQTYNLQPLGTEGQTDRSYTSLEPYDLISWSVNYGGGFKFHIKRNLSANIDFTIHRTMTDYLDDVSGAYPSVISLKDADKGIAYQLYDRSKELGNPIGLEGKQRGSMNGNDDFATMMFTVSWTFINRYCPSERF